MADHEASEDSAAGSSIDDGPEDIREVGIEGDREILVPITASAERLAHLVDRVDRQTRVVLTDGAERVAVLVDWGWYAAQQERLARATAAYWASWRTGRFDTAGYAAAVLERMSSADHVGDLPPDDEGTAATGTHADPDFYRGPADGPLVQTSTYYLDAVTEAVRVLRDDDAATSAEPADLMRRHDDLRLALRSLLATLGHPVP